VTLIPTLKCSNVAEAVAFYTRQLDFMHHGTWPATGNPAYAVLTRNGCELHLSSHAMDGVIGQPLVVVVDDLDTCIAAFRARGLSQSSKVDSPVHLAPVNQSWRTREFYVDDPDGNTLRFQQRG
jgi:catechol 2,3-dioxygenase-like lactoylglutathione lyase family enzyme